MKKIIWPLAVVFTLAILAAALLVGSSDWQQFMQSQLQQQIFWQIRLPRVLLALLVGASLALAGSMIQAIIRNPLADPGLIGVSGGAALGAALSLFLMHLLQLQQAIFVMLGAFVMGLLATLLVMTIGRRQSHNMSLIILAGIAVNVLAVALIGLISYLAPDQTLRQINFWTLGSVASADMNDLLMLFVVLCPVSIWVALQHKKLDALLLGESEARSLGVDVKRFNFTVVLLVAVLVAVAVSLTGTIGFIGLVTPHIARLLVGARHQLLIPMAMLLGAALLMAADLGSRMLIAPAELPIGIITALIGAPVFIALLIREGKSDGQ